MPDDLNDVVERIAALWTQDLDRRAILRELRTLQAATWREAAEVCRNEHREYLGSAKQCDDAKHHYGGTMDTVGALACRELGEMMLLHAAALHPKESTDE